MFYRGYKYTTTHVQKSISYLFLLYIKGLLFTVVIESHITLLY